MDLEKIRKLKEQREEKAAEAFSSELKYALKSGFNVLRLVGDPEICLQAWIKHADGKNHPYVFEADGVMMELINAVLDYTVEQNTSGKFARRYTYEGMDIFQIVKNQGWMPKEVYLFNCIPRELQKDPSANQHQRTLASWIFPARRWRWVRNIPTPSSTPAPVLQKVLQLSVCWPQLNSLSLNSAWGP